MEKLVGIILMAGLSTRFESSQNKQLYLFKGKPVFSYSIDTFSNYQGIDELIVVINKTNKLEIEKYINDKSIKAKVILGGLTRQESVENALNSLSLSENDVVLIHDAARPLIDFEIIEKVAKAASEFGAATAYLEATDTIAIKNENDEIQSFVNRNQVAQIQTPQAFKFSVIKKAHEIGEKEATDDCSLVLKAGNKVKLVKGDKKYHKITTIKDIKYLEGLI